MRVVVITTKEDTFHKYLAAELAKCHQVVGVLHPVWPRPSRAKRWELARKRIERFGLPLQVLHALMRRGLVSEGWDEQADIAAACRRFIPKADADYARHVAPVAQDVEDINALSGVATLRALRPDVVVCSGGPIYRADIITAAGNMFNFHTGLSPIYNGARTIFWTYANRQPHVTAGTLMRTSTVVDGGDILGHYLPAVEPGDTPGVQFIKTIMGGTAMYSRFLAHLESGKPWVALPQGRSFRVYFEDEWTPFQSLAIARLIASDVCRKFQAPERTHDYWSASDREAARAALRAVLLGVVYPGDDG